VPGLEGGVYITVVFVDRFGLRGPGQNSRLPRTLKTPPSDLFIQIIPHAIGRLRSLSIRATPEDLETITTHLSHPAPLLEELSIDSSYYYEPHSNPVLTPTLFNGDLFSLRVLKLEDIHTELPWRNMVNLTSLKLFYTSEGRATVRQLLHQQNSEIHIRVYGPNKPPLILPGIDKINVGI
jgi:hypothetical protein